MNSNEAMKYGILCQKFDNEIFREIIWAILYDKTLVTERQLGNEYSTFQL